MNLKHIKDGYNERFDDITKEGVKKDVDSGKEVYVSNQEKISKRGDIYYVKIANMVVSQGTFDHVWKHTGLPDVQVEDSEKSVINLKEFKEKFGQKAWNKFDSTKWNLVKDQKSGIYYRVTVGNDKDSFKVKKDDNANVSDAVKKPRSEDGILKAEYSDLWDEYDDLATIGNLDYPGKYAFKSVLGNEELYKQYLAENKNNDDYRQFNNFLKSAPTVKRDLLAKIKEMEDQRDARRREITEILFAKYPVLDVVNDQIGESPILATDVYKAGRGYKWCVKTPEYDNYDVDLTPEQAKELKQFIKL